MEAVLQHHATEACQHYMHRTFGGRFELLSPANCAGSSGLDVCNLHDRREVLNASQIRHASIRVAACSRRKLRVAITMMAAK